MVKQTDYAEQEKRTLRAIREVYDECQAGRLTVAEAIRRIGKLEAEDSALRERLFGKDSMKEEADD